VKLGVEDFRETPFENCEFRGNRSSERRSLLMRFSSIFLNRRLTGYPQKIRGSWFCKKNQRSENRALLIA
jgi:hypothetical protein